MLTQEEIVHILAHARHFSAMTIRNMHGEP